MNNTDLQAYITTLSFMFKQSDKAVRPDEGSGDPPWSHMFDPTTAPDEAVAWLAQWVGVTIETQSSLEADADFYARQRQRVRDHLGWNRGSAIAMRAVVAPLLTGNQTVIFRERDGSAYHITVVTRTDETPDPDAVERALLLQKPAGLTLDYHTITGRDFAEVKADNADFAAAKVAYPTFADMRGY